MNPNTCNDNEPPLMDPKDQLAFLPFRACEASGYWRPRCPTLHSSGADWIYRRSKVLCINNSSHQTMRKKQLFIGENFCWIPLHTFAGLPRESVDCSFWDKRGYCPSPSDVIMRTGLTWFNHSVCFEFAYVLSRPFPSQPAQDKTMDE